jgi:hypothetical protein
MAFFNATTGRWTLFPTSTVPYIDVTLPYFDVSNGSVVWFNEHYGNRMAEICCNRTELTEYSLSNPPAEEGTQIGNALTISQAQSGVWFTEWTADKVGFVNASYVPNFSVTLGDANGTINVQRGSSARLDVELSGNSTRPISFQFSDSEQATGIPKNINFTVSPESKPSLNGSVQVTVTITPSDGAQAGRYIAVITATDGLLSRSVYLELDVQ